MNLIIIILAGITAYILTCLYDIVQGLIAKRILKQEEKKRLSNELYRFQLKQLYYYCKAYYLELGYKDSQADRLAINSVVDMDRNFLVEDKYKLIKNERSKKNVLLRNL